MTLENSGKGQHRGQYRASDNVHREAWYGPVEATISISKPPNRKKINEIKADGRWQEDNYNFLFQMELRSNRP